MCVQCTSLPNLMNNCDLGVGNTLRDNKRVYEHDVLPCCYLKRPGLLLESGADAAATCSAKTMPAAGMREFQ